MDDFLRNQLIRDMRKRFMMSDIRKEALNRARTSVLKVKKDGTVQHRLCKKTGKLVPMYSHTYTCEKCNEVGLAKQDAKVDHIAPVQPYDIQSKEIGTTKFSLGTYVDRLWCSLDNLWVLCKTCHDKKTAIEKKIRARWRAYFKGTALPPQPMDGRKFDEYEI